MNVLLQNTVFVISVATVLGLCIGSFLNVVIYRWPREIAMTGKRSRCRDCNAVIPWYCNIPVVSFLVLRARCVFCGAGISWRYPLVEVLTAALFVLVVVERADFVSWPFFFYLMSALVVTFFVDYDFQLIPDLVTLPGIIIGFAGSFFIAGHDWIASLLGIFLGGGSLWAVGALYAWLKKAEGVGGGDIKFLAMVGAFFGVPGVVITLFSGSMLGSLIGVVVMLVRRGDSKMKIAFGPFLCAGAMLSFLYGDRIWRWYTQPFRDLTGL